MMVRIPEQIHLSISLLGWVFKHMIVKSQWIYDNVWLYHSYAKLAKFGANDEKKHN